MCFVSFVGAGDAFVSVLKKRGKGIRGRGWWWRGCVEEEKERVEEKGEGEEKGRRNGVRGLPREKFSCFLKMRFYPLSRPRLAFCLPFSASTHRDLPACEVSAGSGAF